MPRRPSHRSQSTRLSPALALRLPEPLPMATQILDNGAHVVFCNLPHLHRVSLSVSFGVGSRDEAPASHGVAHLLEHLMFRGSATHPSLRALNAAFEDIGGNFNGYTSRENTSYETQLPPESLDQGLHLLAQCILSPKLTGIAAEREIILEEILADYDEELRLISADDLLIEALFAGGLGRSIAGTPQTLQHLTKKAVLDHYASFYRGPLTVIAIVGRIDDVNQSMETVRHCFGQIPGGPCGPLDAPPAALVAQPKLRCRRYDGAGQTEMALGMRAPAHDSASYPALELAVRLLDDGLSSRLPRRLIDELGLIYDVEAFVAAFRDSSLFATRIACRHRRVARILDEVLGVLRVLATERAPADEMERAKRRIVWEHQSLLDRPSALAQWLVALAHRGQIADPRARCQRLLEVNPDEVRQVAEQLFFQGGQRVVLIGDLGPKGMERARQVMAKHFDQDVALEAD